MSAFDHYYKWPDVTELPQELVGKTIASISNHSYYDPPEDPSAYFIEFTDGTRVAIVATGMHTEGWPYVHVEQR